jgi:hypothetical protein
MDFVITMLMNYTCYSDMLLCDAYVCVPGKQTIYIKNLIYSLVN